MHDVIDALVDEGSFFEVKKLFARELVTGFARLDGRAGRHRRQPAEVEGRGAVRRFGRQGGALHLAVRRLRHPAAVPGRRARLHDRQGGRAAGHHPPRREDDLRGGRRDRAQDLRGGAQGLRRRPVRDVRARLRARRHHRAAAGDDRGDGGGGGGQRRVRQQDRGEAGGRAGRLRRGAARASTAPTSTSSSWRPTCTSTRWSPATTCAPSWCGGSPPPASKSVTGYPRRRAVLPV